MGFFIKIDVLRREVEMEVGLFMVWLKGFGWQLYWTPKDGLMVDRT